MDIDARVQLYDYKTKYQFETVPGVADYNMPLYTVQTQPGNQEIAPYPVYQGFFSPCYANGIQIPLYTQRDPFWKIWPNYIQSLNPAGTGDGTAGPYTLALPFFPAIPGHIDMTGIVSNGAPYQDPPVVPALVTTYPQTSLSAGVYITATTTNNSMMVVTDSGQFLDTNVQIGLLQQVVSGVPQAAGQVNYATGAVTVTFNGAVLAGSNIQAQCYFYQQGIPRAILYYNNTLTIRPPPNIPYLIELDAYLTPAAFLSSSAAVPFAYMAEYIARGAARKILSDTGDMEQFAFYEPLFKEQEILVWKRSQRIFTSSRTGTIFSDFQGSQSAISSIGQGAT